MVIFRAKELTMMLTETEFERCRTDGCVTVYDPAVAGFDGRCDECCACEADHDDGRHDRLDRGCRLCPGASEPARHQVAAAA